MAAIETPLKSARLEAQPLYAQVRETLVQRLITGAWKPGQMLPSEFAIAAELGVSQGTVRKSLDEMTSAGLLIRKQGRGTFVSESEDKSILFRFYRLTPNEPRGSSPESNFPDSVYLSRSKHRASQNEAKVLEISTDDEIWSFERVRSENGAPILWEKLTLPAPSFPKITEQTQLPNNVYQFYNTQHGIIVARVVEELRAVIANDAICEILNLPKGSPVLEIDRRAIALDGRIVEWRLSLCRSDTMHYRNELS